MSQNEPEEEYLTVAEVAGNLKLNQQTVRNWIDRGELPGAQSWSAGPDQALGLRAIPE